MRLVVGVSGASGAPIAHRLLLALRDIPQVETHLVITRGGELTIAQETDYTVDDFHALADYSYPNEDLGARLASGSFKTDGMLVVPCSMKTLAGMASGYCDGLLLRAADVTIKEGRRLVIMPRECPLSAIHLSNLCRLAELGVRVLPPVMSFYNRPQTAMEMTEHLVGKLLDCFGLDFPGYKRWDGMDEKL